MSGKCQKIDQKFEVSRKNLVMKSASANFTSGAVPLPVLVASGIRVYYSVKCDVGDRDMGRTAAKSRGKHRGISQYLASGRDVYVVAGVRCMRRCSKYGWWWTAVTWLELRRVTPYRRRQKIVEHARPLVRRPVKVDISASAAHFSSEDDPTARSSIHRMSLETASTAALKTLYITERY